MDKAYKVCNFLFSDVRLAEGFAKIYLPQEKFEFLGRTCFSQQTEEIKKVDIDKNDIVYASYDQFERANPGYAKQKYINEMERLKGNIKLPFKLEYKSLEKEPVTTEIRYLNIDNIKKILDAFLEFSYFARVDLDDKKIDDYELYLPLDESKSSPTATITIGQYRKLKEIYEIAQSYIQDYKTMMDSIFVENDDENNFEQA